MIVLDASVAIEMLLATPTGHLVEQRVRGPREQLHAPHLLSVEVASVLRRYARSGSVEPGVAGSALDDLARLRVRRWAHEPLLERVWEMRESLSAYDAVYVALAELLGAPLLTTDRRIAGSGMSRARIEVVETIT